MSAKDMEQKSSARIDLPKVVTEAQVKSYIDNGYLVVPDLIAAAELEELKTDITKLSKGEYPCKDLEPLPHDTPDDKILKSVLCIHQPHYISPVILKYIKHPKICGVLSQIVAAHLPWWDGSVKCMQSMFFVKPPDFQGQAWHQDEIYIPTRDRSLLGAWIAVDDASVESGCLWVLPGSHQRGYLYPQHEHNNPDEFDVVSESYGFDDRGEVPVEVKAGALVFFNGYLLHRSRKNRSNQYRRVLVNHYMNAWSLLPWIVREDETPAAADRRAIEHVTGIDPYAWKGIETSHKRVYQRMCKSREQLLESDTDPNL